MKIERSDGITPSERYLKKLCDRAFLSLWSYSSIYRDQKQGEKGDGKELCDLLVVFGNHILIFSDKHIEFPNSGNILLDWSRWYRRAVSDSAKQIFGAERWIKSFPHRLFIDRECRQPFPIQIPDPNEAKFHRIVIAHGVADRCKQFFGGGSGSLVIDNTIIGDIHTGERCMPFSIGQVDLSKGYVHVFDEVTLDVVLQTLDTITDFTSYLSKKEKFLTSHLMVHVTGEEELLAFYFQQLDKKGEHEFILPKENLSGFTLAEGFWENFIHSAERKSQLEANRISYAWDSLIETFNKNILRDNQYYASPTDTTSQEKMVKFLAREHRTRRRMLAKALYGLLNKTMSSEHGARVIAPSDKGDPYYIFLVLPKPEDVTNEKYREIRRELLGDYCLVVKYKFPEAEDIIGFATEIGKNGHRSEDLIYLDARQWTEENQLLAERYHNEMGLLKTINRFEGKEFEFPAEKEKKRKRRRSKK
jgi:hypothetical protein